MTCRYCAKKVPLLKRLTFEDFCSLKHRHAFQRELSHLKVIALLPPAGPVAATAPPLDRTHSWIIEIERAVSIRAQASLAIPQSPAPPSQAAAPLTEPTLPRQLLLPFAGDNSAASRSALPLVPPPPPLTSSDPAILATRRLCRPPLVLPLPSCPPLTAEISSTSPNPSRPLASQPKAAAWRRQCAPRKPRVPLPSIGPTLLQPTSSLPIPKLPRSSGPLPSQSPAPHHAIPVLASRQ